MSQRILIVDDDASIRETFEIHLERRGYEVRSAESGEKALNILEAFEPSLVITDVRMPGMDGVELLRRIRKGSHADVIVITAHESMESAVGAMKAGAYDYLVKPLDLIRIDHLLDQCFRAGGPPPLHDRDLQAHRGAGRKPGNRAHHGRDRHGERAYRPSRPP